MSSSNFFRLEDCVKRFPKSNLLAGQSIPNGRYLFYLSGMQTGRIDESIMNENAIVMGDGGIATVFLGKGNYSYSSHNFAFRSDRDDLSTDYLFRLIENNLDIIDYKGFVGSGLRNIDKNFLFNLLIDIPPFSKQKKIAAILTSVDEVIENIQKQIDKLQDLKKATMNELLTKGIGHKEFKDSKLGRVPMSWKEMRLGKIGKILFSNVDKKSFDNEKKVRLCNYMDVYSHRIIDNTIDFMQATAKQQEIDKFLLRKGDVIITKDSETPDDIAVPSYVDTEFSDVLCGYHLAIIRPVEDEINGPFLSYLFRLEKIRNHFYQLANGSTRFGLTSAAITNSLFIFPPLPEQKKIASILTSIDEKIENTKKKLGKVQSLKKALMQDLLTGRVRVRTE